MKRLLPAILFIWGAQQAHALTWDTTTDGSAITHGNGIWNLTNKFWNNGILNESWPNSPLNDAAFAGNAGGVTTVTIGSDALSVGNVTVGGAGGTMVLAGSYANLTANSLTVQTSGAGKLAITTVGTMANVASFNIANGASLYVAGTAAANMTISTGLSITGSGNNENLGALRLDTNARLQGTINLLGNATFGSNGGTGLIESTISGDFAFNQSSAGNGTIRLTGNNSYTGGTTITRSTVQAGHNAAFGTGTLTLNGGTLSSDSTMARTLANATSIGGQMTLGNATNSGKLTFAGTAQSTAASATLTTNSNIEFADLRATGAVDHVGAGQFEVGSFTALSSNAALTGNAITLRTGGATFNTNGFNATISTPLAGAAGFTKVGAGTLSLSGAGSTFAGAVQIAEGTLRLVPATVTLPSDLDVMPLGDSITFGSNGGYRAPLYSSIQAIAPGFHFVGDSTLNPGTLPAGQQNHSGHSSYSSIDIHNNLDGLDLTTFNTYGGAERNPNGGFWLTGRAADANGPARDPLHPDVILLLVGANDIFRLTMNTQQAHDSYTALLTKITTLRPDAHIFMAQITPHGNATQDQKAVAYNAVVAQVYNEFKAAGKNVTLVDLHTGYTGGLPDGLHPDATGYSWMAGKWRDAIVAALGTSSGATTALSAASSVTVAAGATLDLNHAEASIAGLDVSGSVLLGSGRLSTSAPASFAAGSAFATRINRDNQTAGRLAVTGNLTLGNAALNLTSTGTAALNSGTKFTLATYTGTLAGTFNGLAEKASLTINGIPFVIRYADGGKNITLTVASSYQSWISTEHPALAGDDAQPTADPDADGLANLIEYTLDLDPQTSSPNPIHFDQVTIGNETYLRLSVTRDPDASGVLIQGLVSESLDPASWSSESVEVETNTSEEFRIRDSVPMSAANRRFMRLRFSKL